MNAIRGTVKHGRVSLDVPHDWPEGCAVIIEPLPTPAERIGLDEPDWRDDAAGLAEWEAWIKTVEPLEFTADEEAAFARFQEQMRRYNIEAVRKQMEEGPLP